MADLKGTARRPGAESYKGSSNAWLCLEMGGGKQASVVHSSLPVSWDAEGVGWPVCTC